MSKLYSVYDKRAQTFGQIMAMPTDAHAVRSFTQEVNREDSTNMLNQFPDDFSIHLVGEFNEDTGELKPERIKLLEAIAAKRPQEANQKRA